jgi:outer membrane protein OmpA-like peptidoglycan-associated protein
MRRKLIAAGLGLALSGWSAGAWAEPSGSAAASTSGGASGSASPSKLSEAEKNSSEGFWRRYRPTHLGLELGVYGGMYGFPYNHNLQSFKVVDTADKHQGLSNAPQVGARLGLYPLSFLGGEVEGGIVFTEATRTDDKAKVYYVRGHGILQLPLGRLVPFVLGGGGITHIVAPGSLGKDTDPVIYFGGGLKFQFIQRLALRIDVRDNFVQKNKYIAGTKDGDLLQDVEVTGGLSVTWGRTPWTEAPPDGDADGVLDRDDQCPADAGPAPTGCPPPPDADRDGIPDASDPCPTEAEDGNPPDAKDGCPNKDLDGDKIDIPVDLCPDQPGIAPDGCPPKDTDGDGFMDPDDRCPKDAETKNNFEDQDGCPDEVPDQVKKFTGVIKGINFDTGKAKIRASSFPLLDDAVSVLKTYPTLRIRISGHTDNKGKPAKNMKLSEDRANSVKDYMTSKGVEGSRVETRGVGPDEPIADNKTNAGRTQNRRIEFELLPQ